MKYKVKKISSGISEEELESILNYINNKGKITSIMPFNNTIMIIYTIDNKLNE